MSGAPVKFYFDLLSQPSRALYIFLKQAKIPFDEHQIALRQGKHPKQVITQLKKLSHFIFIRMDQVCI